MLSLITEKIGKINCRHFNTDKYFTKTLSEKREVVDIVIAKCTNCGHVFILNKERLK